MMKKFTIITGLLASLLFYACQDYESVSPYIPVAEEKYEGTLLEFLSDKSDDWSDYTFDSMLVIIDAIPGLRAELEKEEGDFTLFAVPDECFERSFKQLNAYRDNKNLGGKISLDDLLVEPFIVEDTIINNRDGRIDTLITKYNYDYRSQLDSLFCRYIFNGMHDTKEILDDANHNLSVESFKNRYQMNMACHFLPSSGVVNGGTMAFSFSDMNGSQLTKRWETTDVIQSDIYARNGVIHIITEQHSFSFNKFINYFKNRGNEYEKD